jgi:small-conductance mechanosensitive channel
MDWITGAWPSGVLSTVAVVAAVLLVHMAVWRLVLRLMKDRDLAEGLRVHLRWPARAVVTLAAMLFALPTAGLPRVVYGRVFHVLLLALVAAGAWLAVRVVRVAEDALMRRYDVEVPDNLRARRARTQIQVLGRVMIVTIVVLALAFMLLTFPQARAVGTSLLASAGIVGVVAGVAARSTVGNLIAGLQIAFAEPIRLDDAVVVEGEWGNIEEITLTYVVVRIWDRRRLVLPCSYFVERPIQNWTRYSADIVGTVHLHVDYTTSVEEVRAEFERVLAASKLWNGQTAVLQVVDTTERTMVLRALVSADSAPSAWDLRCEVRERLLSWLQQQQPGALPRVRAELEAPAPQPLEAPAPERRWQGRR